jgi:hypothetical protein
MAKKEKNKRDKKHHLEMKVPEQINANVHDNTRQPKIKSKSINSKKKKTDNKNYKYAAQTPDHSAIIQSPSSVLRRRGRGGGGSTLQPRRQPTSNSNGECQNEPFAPPFTLPRAAGRARRARWERSNKPQGLGGFAGLDIGSEERYG